MLTKDITIVDGTNGVIYDHDIQDVFYVSGTAALTVNWAVVYTGTPTKGEVRTIKYRTKTTTLGVGVHILFLGATMPDEYLDKDLTINCQYNGSAWDILMVPDFDETSIIITDHLKAKAVTTAKIDDKAVDTGQIADGAVEALQLNADAVTTIKILDANVTLPKLATQAANTLLANATAGAASPTAIALAASTFPARLSAGNIVAATVAQMQTELAIRTTVLPDAKIWVGNAANVAVDVTPSGDVIMSNTGAFTIDNSSITPTKAGQETIGARTLGIVSCKFVDGATLKALLDGTLNTLFTMTGKDIILRVDIAVQTAHGAPSTIDVGADAVLRTAGADGNGFIEVANAAVAGKYSSDNYTYSGALLKFGQFNVDATGDITVQSSIDISAGAFVGFACVYYLPI